MWPQWNLRRRHTAAPGCDASSKGASFSDDGGFVDRGPIVLARRSAQTFLLAPGNASATPSSKPSAAATALAARAWDAEGFALLRAYASRVAAPPGGGGGGAGGGAPAAEVMAG